MNEPPTGPRFIPNENYGPPSGPPPGQPPGGGWPAEPPGGTPPPPRKRHLLRNTLLSIGAFFLAGGIASAAINGHTNTAASSPASASPSAAPATPAASAAPPDCATQVQDWFGNGGSSQLKSFGADISALGDATTMLGTDLQNGADATADETTVQSDAATVQSDAQALQGNPPPSCVPGLRSDVEAAAGYYSTSAIDASNCLNQLSAGNMTVADGDIQAATAALDEGNVKLQAATSDVQAFNNGQG